MYHVQQLMSSSVSLSEDVLQKHNLNRDKTLIKEITTTLCSSDHLLKTITKRGSLNTVHLHKQYYQSNFSVTEPAEYILNNKEKNSPVCACVKMQNTFES